MSHFGYLHWEGEKGDKILIIHKCIQADREEIHFTNTELGQVFSLSAGEQEMAIHHDTEFCISGQSNNFSTLYRKCWMCLFLYRQNKNTAGFHWKKKNLISCLLAPVGSYLPSITPGWGKKRRFTMYIVLNDRTVMFLKQTSRLTMVASDKRIVIL